MLKNLVDKGNSFSKVQIDDQLFPQKDENGNWFFTTEREFKIMHLTDIYIGGGFLSKTVDEKALNAIAAMVTREKPDLVIATGDIAYSGIDKLGSQRGCTMITCKPDTTFTIDKYNFYSDRYNIEGFTREDVTMQFEEVTYQVIPE